MTKQTGRFVLVHGAWHGGWCYARVAKLLRSRGHEVWTPTLSGLGERAHTYSPAINLSTHIRDIVGVLESEDLCDVVLCGHSYAGMVVTGAADAAADRIRSLVYLDAFVPRDGQSTFDLDTAAAVANHLSSAARNGGHTLPPVPAESFAVNPGDCEYVTAKCTPQPLATLCERISLRGSYANVEKHTYVFATGWPGTPFRSVYEEAMRQPGWKTYEVLCGHDVMLDMPEALADLLISELS